MSQSGVELGVRAIVLRGDKLLVIRRDRFGKKYFVLPGGGVDEGETPEAAVVREAKEETSLEVDIIRKVFDQNRYNSYPRQLVYLCEAKGEDVPKLSEDSIEWQLNQTGNKYSPDLVSIDEIENSGVEFLPQVLLEEIKRGIKNGFPKQAKTIG